MSTPNETSIADLPEQLKLLETHALNLARENKHEDAERLYREILKTAPHNMAGLRYLAARAVVKRDFNRAQIFIERAIKVAPRKPALYQNLAIILRAKNLLEEALQAFRISLQLNPNQPLCWIQQGDVFQALGRTNEAITSYNHAASITGSLGALANAHRNNPQTRIIIARAAKLLVSEREKAIANATRNIVKQDDEDKFARAMTAGTHMSQSALPEYVDPLQRPSFCYFPGLDAKPFYDRSEFAFLKTLEKAYKQINAEFWDILSSNQEHMQPYVKIDEENTGPWSELNYSTNWKAYHLYENGKRIDENCNRCPQTARIIQSLPLAKITGQAPEVFFSVLKPGTRIPPHYGVANYKLTVHLPLTPPNHCGMRVGGITKNWKQGKCLIFDDSFENEAWNNGDELSVILSLEIWNPLIEEEEKVYINKAIAGLEAFRHTMDNTLAELIGRS